ncbi:hypothetical protein QUA41_26645 [Microcoleus sp. Pol11C1]
MFICLYLRLKKGISRTADENGLTRINADLARAFGFGGRLGKWGVAEGRSVIYGC